MLGEDKEVISGYVLPKFDTSNMREYQAFFKEVNADGIKYRCMPTLESLEIADSVRRTKALAEIKESLDEIKDSVLNVRVGGNDFSNLFAIRRSVDQNVYQMGVVASVLYDIINVFSRDYVVSGPVWEYFETTDSDEWKIGLEKELALDKINGFVGKTAIHPSQLPVIHRALAVDKRDLEDAMRILEWRSDALAVEKSENSGRMNERKCHYAWAKKIAILAKIYGVKEE